ncbi:hypothetical protein ASPCAL04031 [Aspergillus calidoustus]|uniref:Class II aldolase/adducin N-terminal domain-containing protein n=1 Tax=Aspergillus calidoustus TaxID=454130 RepID=A0A0U5GQ10_ASPCI|nr:hypothetical protein ASPCAL04031 [Aspergillus calidoustus]
MAPSIDQPAAAQDISRDKKETALEKISQGTPLPGVPKFTNVELQRQHMLNHMAGAFRVFARHGFVEGMSGHISLRDPEFPERFWTNPLGFHFAPVKPSDLILVDESGVAVGGNMSRPANAAGFLIHAALHKGQARRKCCMSFPFYLWQGVVRIPPSP